MTDDNLGALGHTVRARRRDLLLSLRDVGELTRIASPRLSQIERGQRRPSPSELDAIAEAIDVPPASLRRHLPDDPS